MSGYVRMGRGGVGNMIPKEEVAKKEQEDLEAQTARGKTPEPIANIIAEEEAKQPTPPGEYKHRGRGGAGNYYTPTASELESEERVTAPEDEPATPVGQSSHHKWTGRGGAGNFAPQNDEPQREFELKDVAQKVKDDVRQSVDMVLERPGKAHLSPEGGRA